MKRKDLDHYFNWSKVVHIELLDNHRVIVDTGLRGIFIYCDSQKEAEAHFLYLVDCLKANAYLGDTSYGFEA